MEVGFLDLKGQYLAIKDEIDAAIADVIDRCAFALGPAVARFEENFAEYCRVKHCVGVDSGTSALFLTLRALGIGPGVEVITAANTFIATVAAIVSTGAKPILVDVGADSRNIDINLIEPAVTPATRAIMPVHLYGAMVDMKAINELAERHNLIVIEDAAQAQGARFDNQPAGSFGRAAAFSFYPGKNLGAYGEAGAIVTSDDDLAKKLRRLRDHGSIKKYHHDIFGFNARMHGMQGAVLDVKLKHLDDWNQKRNRVAERYRERLADLPVELPPTESRRYDVYHQFVIAADNRDELQRHLSEKGVQTLIHYPIPIHKQAAFIDRFGDTFHYPVTERLAERILSLPIYPEMTDDMIDYVADQIGAFYK